MAPIKHAIRADETRRYQPHASCSRSDPPGLDRIKVRERVLPDPPYMRHSHVTAREDAWSKWHVASSRIWSVIHIVTPENDYLYRDEMEQAYRLRHRVFVEELGWTDLAKPDGREIEGDHRAFLLLRLVQLHFRMLPLGLPRPAACLKAGGFIPVGDGPATPPVY